MNNFNDSPNSIKIGLLGDSGVGKTNIINSILDVGFNEDEISTIGSYKFTIKILLKKENKVKLIIWDSSGQERFRSIVLNNLKNVEGIILVFDVTNRKSFENIDEWLRLIKENIEQNPDIILFGNKADVEKEKWKVTKEEIKQYLKKMKLDYFEISTKINQGINEGLFYLTNNLYDKLEEKRKRYVVYQNLKVDNNNNKIILKKKDE